MPDKFYLPTADAWKRAARETKSHESTRPPLVKMKRRIYTGTDTDTNTTTAGCPCCDSYDCINSAAAVIGTCTGCPNGAALQYNLQLGNWQGQPTVTNSFGTVLFTNLAPQCSGLGTSSSSSSSSGDPCTWYSCPFFLSYFDTSSSTSIIGTYHFELTFGLSLSGRSTAQIKIVFDSGTDWVGAGTGEKWFESHDGFNCRCESPMYPVDATLIPNPVGLNYAPCLIPVVQYRCCCNCFTLNFPGVTVNVPSSSSTTNTNVALLLAVCGAQTIPLSQTQLSLGPIGFVPADLTCTQFWGPGFAGNPNPHQCAWGSWKTPTGTYPTGFFPPLTAIPAQTPYSFVTVTTYYPPGSSADVINLLISFNDVSLSGFHYATAGHYQCGNWTCDGGNFNLVNQSGCTGTSNLCVNQFNSGSSGGTCEPTITANWPSTLIVTPVACPSSSSSSSTSG